MRLVSVVTSTRSPPATRRLISESRSSTCACAGRTSTSGIDQARRPHHLLDDLAGMLASRTSAGVAETKIVCGSELLELLEAQRPVVERRRQPEAVVDQVFLARAIAPVHGRRAAESSRGFVDDQARAFFGGDSRPGSAAARRACGRTGERE